MPSIDTTYSFFSSPELETIPPLSKTKNYVKRESARMSQPDLVSYQKRTPSTAVEEWALDASYGYFSCPSLHPEPVHLSEYPPTKEEASIFRTAQVAYEGYSYFGI
jgi:hypothetical protein